jgi:hypothetical protein
MKKKEKKMKKYKVTLHQRRLRSMEIEAGSTQEAWAMC